MKKNYSNKNADLIYKNYLTNPENIPFSFIYGGEKIKGFPSTSFTLADKDTQSQDSKETNLLTFKMTDGLTVKVKLTHYYTHGATEFTVYFENNTDKNSLVIENPRTEIKFVGANPVLKGILGDHDRYYEPYTFDFYEDQIEFKQTTGKPTEEKFPYFNLEHGNGGTMLVIGWGGTWSANFEKTDDGVLYTANSVNGFKTYLKPNEKIRTALFVMAHYTVRDEDYATNYWRDWYFKYNMPKLNREGKKIKPFTTGSLSNDTGRPKSDGSISEYYGSWKPSLEKMLSENIKVDYRWVDAGWYQRPDKGSAIPFEDGKDWFCSVGTWELDPKKWPNDTFKESVDFAHQNGIKTLLWFEPERVEDVDNMVKNFGYKKEWAINPADFKQLKHLGNKFYQGADHYYDVVSNGEVVGILNNIGNEECLKYTAERICKLLRDNKIDMYREDRNSVCPAPLWHYNDLVNERENRFGITESKAVDGHYKLWDTIIECTSSYGGDAFIDSCSSGGCRNDLESLRRSIPLLRSDFDRTTIGVRLSISSTFNKWIPFNGSSTKETVGEHDIGKIADPYVWRASYLPVLNVRSRYVYEEEENFEKVRFGIDEWKRINKYLVKEFYTLTPWYHRFDETKFSAMAYFDNYTEKGIILAFRMVNCKQTDLEITLPFIEENAEYILTDEDTKENLTLNGKELSLFFENPRSAKLIWIEKQN